MEQRKELQENTFKEEAELSKNLAKPATQGCDDFKSKFNSCKYRALTVADNLKENSAVTEKIYMRVHLVNDFPILFYNNLLIFNFFVNYN